MGQQTLQQEAELASAQERGAYQSKDEVWARYEAWKGQAEAALLEYKAAEAVTDAAAHARAVKWIRVRIAGVRAGTDVGDLHALETALVDATARADRARLASARAGMVAEEAVRQALPMIVASIPLDQLRVLVTEGAQRLDEEPCHD